MEQESNLAGSELPAFCDAPFQNDRLNIFENFSFDKNKSKTVSYTDVHNYNIYRIFK